MLWILNIILFISVLFLPWVNQIDIINMGEETHFIGPVWHHYSICSSEKWHSINGYSVCLCLWSVSLAWSSLPHLLPTPCDISECLWQPTLSTLDFPRHFVSDFLCWNSAVVQPLCVTVYQQNTKHWFTHCEEDGVPWELIKSKKTHTS